MKYTILIAEDDEQLLKVLRKQFENNDFSVKTADNGATAFELYKSYNPHVVLMDIDMPEKSGWQVLELIRKQDTLTPVFIMTNHHMQEDGALTSYGLGATAFIRKTVSVKEMVALIKSQMKTIYDIPEIISFGHLQLNMSSYILQSPSANYPLKERQAKVLALLAKNKNQLVNSKEIHSLIWNQYDTKNQQMVKNLINNLRDILEKEGISIEPYYGKGYTLKLP
nr:response regulator transcription factor [Bacteroidales bacterium]